MHYTSSHHNSISNFVVVSDNDLEYGRSRDRENDGNTGDVEIFRQVSTSRRIIALCHVFLFCKWQLVLC
jgi:hypothetical protein